MIPLPVTIFSDFTCPHSYVVEAILWQAASDEVELRFRSLELFPVGVEPDLPPHDIATDEWSTVERLSLDAGITLHRQAKRPRTGKAHEAVHAARERGLEIELRQRIFAAYWKDGEDIARIDVLTSAAGRAGMEPEEMKIALDIDRFAGDVRADLELAQRLRVPGTPTIFLGTGPSARVVIGAQPAGELIQILHETIRSRAESE